MNFVKRFHPTTVRVVIYLILLFGLMAGTEFGLPLGLRVFHLSKLSFASAFLLIQIAFSVYAFVLMRLVWGKARFDQFVRCRILDRGFLWKLGLGLAMGCGIQLAQVLILWGNHQYRIDSINWDFPWTYDLIALGFVALAEETVFRGYLLEDFQGMQFQEALLLSSLLFALAHLIAPGVPLTADFVNMKVAVTFVGGIVYGLSYSLSRSLWLPIGLHLGFDLFSIIFFGFQPSPLGTLFRSSFSNNASVVVELLTLLIAAWLMWIVLKQRSLGSRVNPGH